MIQCQSANGTSDEGASAHDKAELANIHFGRADGQVEVGCDGGVEGAAEGGDVEDDGWGACGGVGEEEVEGLFLGVDYGMEFVGGRRRVMGGMFGWCHIGIGRVSIGLFCG